jgi:hypothetical protein
MSKQSIAQTGRTKNRAVSAYDHRSKTAKQRSEFAARLTRAREERHRVVELSQPDDAAFAVALYRAEKARALAKGVAVAPTIEEWRERISVTHTVIGDLAP